MVKWVANITQPTQDTGRFWAHGSVISQGNFFSLCYNAPSAYFASSVAASERLCHYVFMLRGLSQG